MRLMTAWLQRELLQRYDGWQIPWDELWLSHACLLAMRSRCSRDRVGAVMVTDDNLVISSGYNGSPPTFTGDKVTQCAEWCPRAVNTPLGEPGSPGYHDCHATHAELNAMSRAPRVERGVTTRLYVSRVPCYPCAKMIGSGHATHNLRQVIVPVSLEANAQHGDIDHSVSFLTKCGITVRFI
jgi:dCMP deaminase